MHLANVRRSRLIGAGAVIAVLFSAQLVWGVQGAGSLFVASSTSQTPTHWNIPIGVPIKAEIRGVLPSEVGGSLPAELDVIVKSSVLGNTTLVGTRIDDTSNYTFTYTAPLNACATTIVAYYSNGQNTNNDLIDDGMQNGSSDSASGFRFVDDDGDSIPCTVGVEAQPWSSVKALYRD